MKKLMIKTDSSFVFFIPQLIQADTKQWGIYTPKESLRTSPQLRGGKVGNFTLSSLGYRVGRLMN